MIDLFSDIAGSLFASSSPPGARGRRTSGQELTWGLAIMGFPLLDFALVTQVVALGVILPFVFSAATAYLAARTGGAGSFRFMALLCCFFFCLGASFFGMLFGAGGFF